MASAADPAASRRPRQLWPAIAVGVFVVGATASALAGTAVARTDADRARRSFRESSTAVAATLQLAIQHEEDLVANASVFLVLNPDASTEQFRQWAGTARVLERYPELQTLVFLGIVPAAELDAYAAAVIADPATPLAPGTPFEALPAGDRELYCFATLELYRGDEPLAPPGTDYCGTSETREDLISARDSGLDTYFQVPVSPGVSWLAVQTPIYLDGEIPATADARRAAFVGWVGIAIDPNVVLERALAGRDDIGVTFRFEDTAFERGRTADRTYRSLIDLDNGWTIETFGDVDTDGALRNGSALGLMSAGIGFSALLAALILVLATSRVRALGLVGERTDELRHQALHDGLTGLPNRALIMDRLDQLLARSRRNGTTGATLFLDLDGFKNVNDTLGHETGDRLLQSVAERLTATLRDADTIGRMGGDEFVVLIDGGTLDAASELVAERVLEVMRQPFTFDASPTSVMITASIGIASGAASTPADALRDADMALYEAKAGGRNRYEFFRPEMEASIRHRYELEFDLRAASEGDQFRLVYQPIYDLADLTIVGVEALIRWEHPTLGEIQPDDFISLLESSGQIVEVGRWALLEACTQMATWRERGSDLIVSVNVSGRQLDHDVIVDHVRDALTSSGLNPASLTIEITETALMRDIESSARRLDELKSLGIQIAIDDFGTGYSSIAYLQRLPVDCLKIDRTFTDALTRSPDSDALVHTLVQLGKDLGLKTLAEGVETSDQIDHLRGQHVNEVQGFLLGRPLDPEVLEARLLEPNRTIEPPHETTIGV